MQRDHGWEAYSAVEVFWTLAFAVHMSFASERFAPALWDVARQLLVDAAADVSVYIQIVPRTKIAGSRPWRTSVAATAKVR